MKPPAFWDNPPDAPGWRSFALSPLSRVVEWATARRLRRGDWHRTNAPVICVGNINVGGTGKTPTVIALQSLLQAQGLKPHVVSRGYGGTFEGPVKVDPRKNTADQVGDEPLLIAAFGDTWVAKDRRAGAEAAIREGADVILLDDGFQNPSLHKDLSLVVIDARAGFGNGLVMPAGGLRERPEAGLRRADAVVLIGDRLERQSFLKAWPVVSRLPVLEAELNPLETGMDWTAHKYLAFAGIGRPQKFFATLRKMGVQLIRTESLDDHQKLDLRLLHRLEAEAFFKGAQLMTTEKDATRLPEEFKLRVVTLPVRLCFQDDAAVHAILSRVLPAA